MKLNKLVGWYKDIVTGIRCKERMDYKGNIQRVNAKKEDLRRMDINGRSRGILNMENHDERKNGSCLRIIRTSRK